MTRAGVLCLALFVGAAGVRAVPQASAVRVWQSAIDIPTYAEGPANPNPPFDFFTFGRFNYPYPIRDALTDRRETVRWRTLHLENEYLRLTVLPDLGGHIYGCLDKRSGREMFYANTSIKKALIGYRGAWAAFGVEFNFPVSHNWMSMSPVDFATRQHADGSGSIWVGNIDQVYGSQWRVELRLQPARAALEQHVELYNLSDVRHRYYWWSNAAVQAWDDSTLVYPTDAMATHGFTRVVRWPVDDQGRDLSVIRNQTAGPVSLFTHQTREEFVGVYHPRTNSGTVHVSSRSELPTHKVWSWGNDREAAFWRTALSDDDSAYVELQAGLFRNQETYAFLEPQESVRFTEYWLPVRDLGGITRANVDAVVHMRRPSPGRMRIALDVLRDLPGARIALRGGASETRGPLTLSPRDVWRIELDRVSSEPVTFEVADANGRIVLSHTENVFDRPPASAIEFGPRVAERASETTASAAASLERGTLHELDGRRLTALATYRAGLERFPTDGALLKAAGRLVVALGWPNAGGEPSSRAIAWLQAAHARHTTDAEIEYYLALALAAAGRDGEARRHLESASRFRSTRAAALLQLAALAAREGDSASALRHLRTVREESPRSWSARAIEVALLRRGGRDAAGEWLRHARSVDPTNSLLRHELALSAESDPELWIHLAADANRVLDLVDQYLSIGDDTAAHALLERSYPDVKPPLREPGAVVPRDSPLIAYYRGYVRERLGRSPAADYERARSLSTTYVFPARRSSYAVLGAALRANPEDGVARYLLGSLYLASGLSDQAIDAWQRVRKTGPPIATLHRSLGLALLHGRGDYAAARAVLEEGAAADPANVEVYLTLDAVLSAAGVPASERVAALQRFPPSEPAPSALVFKRAIALAEAGDAAGAERLFHGRFFPREEGGTNVRTVYAQVLLASARASAEGKDCGAARRLLESMSRERPELAFTRGGLGDAYEAPVMAMQVADVESACGQDAAARMKWERLERTLDRATAPLSVAVAADASRRLGKALTPEGRARIDTALDEANRVLESAGTSSPGTMQYARGLLLASLGRHNDSREALRRVFIYPDRGLSHALARIALRQSISGKTR